MGPSVELGALHGEIVSDAPMGSDVYHHASNTSSIDGSQETLLSRFATPDPAPLSRAEPPLLGSSDLVAKSRWTRFWKDNKGAGLMVVSQLCGAAMAAVARLLETSDEEGPPMHPFQVCYNRKSTKRGLLMAAGDPLR